MSRSNWFSSRRSPVSRRPSGRRKSPRLSRRRKAQRLEFETLEERRVLAATVTTDFLDYSPGSTAQIFASDFAIGETVEFQVLHTDGVPNTGAGHEPWQVTDGVLGDFNADGILDGDLDGVADGNIHTTWCVNPDDSTDSTFELTANGLSSGLAASYAFTDSVSVVAGSTTNSSSSSRTSASFGHTVAAGVDRLLVVSVMTNGNEDVTSISYGGQTLTQAVERDGGDSDEAAVEIWYLVAPNVGTANMVVTFASSVDPSYIRAENLTGVHQSSPIGNTAGNSGDGDDILVTIPTSAANSLIYAALASHGGDTDPFDTGSGITQLWDDDTGSSASNDIGVWGGYRPAPTMSFYTMGVEADKGDNWSIAAVEIRMAQAAQENPAINIEKLINGQDADSATGPILAAGGAATFTYNVTNAGNVALSNISVTDDNGTPGIPGDNFSPTFTGGDTNSNSKLDVGETWTYTAARTVAAGQYTNVGTASGKSPSNTTVSGTDPANYFGAAPGISIEKHVNGVIADTPIGPILPVGSTATFTYIVTNTGNVPLSSVSVVDDNGTPGNPADNFTATFTGGDLNGNSLLDTNETWSFSATRTVIAGQYTNVGTASGKSSINQNVSATDPANYFGAAPSINFEKLVNGQDADAVSGPILAAGSTATFTYKVTNSGNISVGSIAVVDDNGTPGNTADNFSPTFTSGDSNSNGLLDLGETWTYSANRTVVAGQYTNSGSVTGSVAATGQSVSDTDLANYFGAAPSINIEKLVNGQDADTATGPILATGSMATFTYQVTNTGNFALGSIAVVDDNGTPGNFADDFNPIFTGGDANNNSLLDLGETWTFTATATATPGQYTNIGAVSGQVAATGQTASDSDPANYFGAAPSLDIEKHVNGNDADSAPGQILHANDPVTFTYTVTNTGNISLGSIVVVDDNGTPGSVGDDFNPTISGGDTNSNGLLDLGETWSYSTTTTAIVGQYTNLGTATGSVAATGQIASDFDAANYFGKVDIIVIAPDKGNTSHPIVKVINQDSGKIISQFYAYEGKFRGGVQLAVGDLTGDGIDEIIVAPGQGRVGEVRVFTQHGVELTQFRTLPYGVKYAGGIEVAVGDVNGDGKNDIVTATKYGRADIRVFYNSYDSPNPYADPIANVANRQFYAFASNFKGGADVIVADLGTFYNGVIYDASTPDGKSEIIVGNGPGMRSTIHVYDVTAAPTIVDTILPFANSFKGGITLSAARVNSDAIPDLIVAAGNAGGGGIEIWSGLTNDYHDLKLTAFSAFGDTATKNMPTHATALDTNGDGVADLLAVVQGTNGTSNQIRYHAMNGALDRIHHGFYGPWNIASLANFDPSLPINSLYDAAAKDDIYTQLGAVTTTKPAKKAAKPKKK